MGVEQFHSASRVWHFTDDAKFVLDFDALETHYNEKAREEGFTTEKQYISIKEIEVDQPRRALVVKAELYKLLEN